MLTYFKLGVLLTYTNFINPEFTNLHFRNLTSSVILLYGSVDVRQHRFTDAAGYVLPLSGPSSPGVPVRVVQMYTDDDF